MKVPSYTPLVVCGTVRMKKNRDLRFKLSMPAHRRRSETLRLPVSGCQNFQLPPGRTAFEVCEAFIDASGTKAGYGRPAYDDGGFSGAASDYGRGTCSIWIAS